MGQKVNPIANRLGIIRGWDSNWYGGKNFADKLVEDAKIREYLNARLAKASISRIIIERTLKVVTVTISTARPGMIIGKGGQEVDKLKEELKKLTGKEIQINIFEIRRPELDAVIVANNIARQLEGRISYRRAIKTTIASTMRMGAEGIKIQVSGRIGGAEMARSETFMEGRVPLHTFRADIDYHLAEALTKVGLMGIKVWIFTGEVYEKRDLFEIASAAAQPAGRGPAGRGGGERGERDGRRPRGAGAGGAGGGRGNQRGGGAGGGRGDQRGGGPGAGRGDQRGGGRGGSGSGAKGAGGGRGGAKRETKSNE